MSTVQSINTLGELDDIGKNSGGKAIIIDFHATWCGPCKVIGPKFEAMTKEFPSVIGLKVDVDEAEEVAESMGVTAMPTFVALKYENGSRTELGKLVGASEEKLRALFIKHSK